tara:strand:+ start:423 stop:719 length:297 start_codon:yes stop_codon:yes gene_type:complete
MLLLLPPDLKIVVFFFICNLITSLTFLFFLVIDIAVSQLRGARDMLTKIQQVQLNNLASQVDNNCIDRNDSNRFFYNGNDMKAFLTKIDSLFGIRYIY